MSVGVTKTIAVKPETYGQLVNLAVGKGDTFDKIISRLIQQPKTVHGTTTENKKEESLPASVGPLSETATVATTQQGSATT